MFCKIVLATALLVTVSVVACPGGATTPEDTEGIKKEEEEPVQNTPSQTSAPNKRITMQEYIDILKKNYPEGDPSKMGTLFWRRYYDKNNVGSIDEKEFLQKVLRFWRGEPEEILKRDFYIFDINGDGHITRDELREVDEMIVLGKGKLDNKPKALLKAFHDIDKDQDDKMTLRELLVHGDV